jgi:hypothetical protein
VARQCGRVASEDQPLDGTHQAEGQRGRSGVVLVTAQDREHDLTAGHLEGGAPEQIRVER